MNDEFAFSLLDGAGPRRILIEASAGTGKTYTLERIVLRYLVARRCRIDEILMVTFTNKATQELRGRIRALLETMLENPAAAAGLLAEIGLAGAADWRGHLRAQLDRFALAAIHTIHGFASSVLASNPVECGSRFSLRLDNGYRAELLRDYVRDTLYVGRLPLPDGGCLQGDELTLCLEAAGRGKDAGFEALWEQLAEFQAGRWLDPARYAQGADGQPEPGPAFAALRRHGDLAARLVRGGAADAAEIAALAADLADIGLTPPADADGLAELCARICTLFLCRSVLAGLEAYRQSLGRFQGLVDYDDQIALLHRACRPGGLLLPALRERFRLVLIDEFQDTDAQQWEIFDRLAGDELDLIAVGDPKQAIYGFRGADLNTYLSARGSFAANCRLSVNYRSSPALVAAADALFAGVFAAGAADGGPRLDYRAVAAGLPAGRELTAADGSAVAPLAGLGFELPPKAGVVQARLELRERVADAILELVGGRRLDGGRAVGFADICVLTDANHAAAELQRHFGGRGIPSQLHGEYKLSDAVEAQDVQCLLDAVADPGSLAAARALAHGLFYDAAGPEGAPVQRCLEDAARWHQDFRRLGLPGVLAELEPALRPRLIARFGGQASRRLANLRHIAESFQNHIRRRHVPPARLGAEFREYRQLFRDDNLEAESLRRADDAPAVRIMTIHAAKGLEFPIVFLFAGLKAPDKARRHFRFDRPGADGGWRQAYDLWRDQPAACERLEWAAWLRLFYVAVTRARSACYLPLPIGRPAGPANPRDCALFRMADLGMLAGLAPAPFGETVPGPAPGAALAGNSAAARPADGASAARAAPGAAMTTGGAPPSAAAAPAPADALALLRQLPARAPAGWSTPLVPQAERQSSFTSLTRFGHGAADELFQTPPEPLPPAPEPAAEPEPGGTEYGVVFHAAMERVDFEAYRAGGDAERDALLDALVDGELADLAAGRSFGKDFPSFRHIRGHLRRHIRLSLEAPLAWPGMPERPVHALAGARALREATFHARLPRPALIRACARLGYAEHALDAGYLTGSIDFLVPEGERWCVIDWKTNHCGAGADADLEQEMRDSEYRLQAMIYLSALHQWLCRRQGLAWDPASRDGRPAGGAAAPGGEAAARLVFERRMGPVWYLFARYGRALPVAIEWEELRQFQTEAALYAL